MILNPVLPVWMLALMTAVLGGFALWQAISTRAARRTSLAWVSRVAMVVLLFVIAIRPTIPGEGQGPALVGGLEVYLVVDTTTSMAAEDFGTEVFDETLGEMRPETRLDGVKADIATLTEQLEGAEFSLITFDAAAVQRVPLTSDGSAVRSAASVLNQEISNYSRGSSIDVPLDLLDELLQDAVAANPDRDRVVFYFGDGEQTVEAEPASFEKLAAFINGGAVLGYGTVEGGAMREFTGPYDDGTGYYIQDYTQSPVVDAISRIDETQLEAIAAQLGVQYVLREAGDDLKAVTSGIDVGEVTAQKGEPDSPIELYWILAIPLGLLVLLETFGVVASLRELRAARGLS